MDARTTRTLRLAAGQFAVLAGMLHIGLGLRYWVLYAMGGLYLPPDVRVPLWTASGVAVLAGVAVATRTERRALVYALGLAGMLVYVLGYFSWHLGSHRSFYLGGDPNLHGVGLGRFLLDHALAGPIEFAALAVEGLAALALAALLVDEVAASRGRSRDETP